MESTSVMSWLTAIAQNLVSDVIFLVLLVGLGWLIHTVTRRRKLLKFFGIVETRRITIYRSRIGVVEGGAIGVDGTKRSYEGYVTPIGEAQGAARLGRLFSHPLPSLGEDPPARLRNLLVADVEVVTTDSPDSADQIEMTSSFITLGSPAYNAVSGYVETHLHSQVHFAFGSRRQVQGAEAPLLEESVIEQVEPGTADYTATTLTYRGGDQRAIIRPTTDTSSSLAPVITPSGTVLREAYLPPRIPEGPYERKAAEDTPTSIRLPDVPAITDPYQGFVARVLDESIMRSTFYVAGISELGTQGAAHYLYTHWRQLAKKYKGQQFVVVIKVENNDFRQLSVVLEKQVS